MRGFHLYNDGNDRINAAGGNLKLIVPRQRRRIEAMNEKPHVAQFEIFRRWQAALLPRHQGEWQIEGAGYLKQRHPHSEVTVRDLTTGHVTAAVYKSSK